MEYNELCKEYIRLLEENKKLRKENETFRKKLGIHINELAIDKDIKLIKADSDNKNVIHNLKLSKVTNASTPKEKIELFMTLFKGRKDVYAKRWENKVGKSGYSPVCINEWIRGVCGKPRIKCSECKVKNYDILSSNAINKHLRGIDVLGIYPMLTDETCYFLAIDFDDEGWKEDISVLREICVEKNIPFAVERSRSGDGAHVWFFFKENISAATARKFGTALLTYAMEKRHEIKFKSYDRFFPNQDTMPKGGLGNLIALPMQKNARVKGNSSFIDENLKVYEDQWGFLSSLKRLSKNEVETYISDLCSGNELGLLKKSEDEIEKPWEIKKESFKINSSNLPEVVHVTKANMLFVLKKGLSHKALNLIKRIAAFKNPEFFRAQAMRLPTFDKARIISLSEETKDYLGIPRGCEEDLCSLMKENNVKIDIDDKTYKGESIKVEFNGELREEQISAAQTLLKYNIGVLSATTAFGKTVIGANLIAKRKVNTLIIVHTQQLMEQWKERLSQFLIIDEVLQINNVKKRGRKRDVSIIGQLGGGKNSLNGIVDIATMQSLVRDSEVKELVKNYGMVIVDECHHVSAFSFELILKNILAKFVYGLTATPIRKDGHQPIIFMQCGPIRYKVDPLSQARKHPFEHYVIPRFTSLKKPIYIGEKEWSIADIYYEIATNEMRNELIAEDVVNCLKDGRNPIVLTERKEHVKVITDILKERSCEVITLTGGMNVRDKRNSLERLSNVKEGNNTVIVATGKFVGEGFDEPRLDTLFLAMPISWKGTLQQYVGRLHRLYENKNEVQIYDYVDAHIEMLERMYEKRLKGYAALGYSAKADNKTFEMINSIYDNKNFYTVFSSDVLSAKKKIVIVSPFIRKKRLEQIIKLLINALRIGTQVSIVTRPETDFKEKEKKNIKEMHKYIISQGVNLIFKSKMHQKFSVIDEKIVWYGSINLLSYGTSEESVMRLSSANIANELMAVIE